VSTKPTTHRSSGKTNYWAAILRAVPLAGLFYGILVLAGNLLCYVIFGDYTNFATKVITGLQLFLLWLIVSSTVRTLHLLAKDMPVVILWLAGGLTAIVSVLLAPIVLSIVYKMGLEVGPSIADVSKLRFYLVLGLIFSLIAIIHVRVRNKALGSTLEWVIVLGLAALFYVYYLK
jgi:hypothetical protein